MPNYMLYLQPVMYPYLSEKVQIELQRMQSLGVTTKLDHPTPWCAGMVVVPKKSGEVHIHLCGFKGT